MNVMGIVATSQAFIPLLRRGQQKGRIVNMGSVVSCTDKDLCNQQWVRVYTALVFVCSVSSKVMTEQYLVSPADYQPNVRTTGSLLGLSWQGAAGHEWYGSHSHIYWCMWLLPWLLSTVLCCVRMQLHAALVIHCCVLLTGAASLLLCCLLLQSGHMPAAFWSPYSTSKHAVEGLTDCMR